MNKFIKRHRDELATSFGALAGICGVLVANGVLDPDIGGSVGGVATVLLGAISNYGMDRNSKLGD